MTIPEYADDNSFARATRSDAEIWAELVEALRWDIVLGPNCIGINVQGGIVTLTGSIDAYTSKWAAEEAAYRVRGVRAVVNDIVVDPFSTGQQRSLAVATLPFVMARPALQVEPSVARWRAALVRGLAGMGFGVITMLTPDPFVASLVLSFGAYAFVDGVSALLESVDARMPRPPRRFLAWQGVLGVVAAAIMVLWPPVQTLLFAYVVAAWAQVTGILELVIASFSLRRDGGVLLLSRGVLRLAMGVALAFRPEANVTALMFWAGVYALVSGGLVVRLSLYLRSWARAKH